MNITDKLAAALREAIPFLQALHASNTNELAQKGRDLLAEYDKQNAPEPIRILVKLEGGLIQWTGTDSDARIEVAIVDYDTEGADDDEITAIPQDNGGTADACARIEQPGVDVEFVRAAFEAINAGS